MTDDGHYRDSVAQRKRIAELESKFKRIQDALEQTKEPTHGRGEYWNLGVLRKAVQEISFIVESMRLT